MHFGKFCFLLFLFCANLCFSFRLNAQRQLADSLIRALTEIREDTQQVIVMRDISFAMYRYHPDSALLWANSGLRKATRIKDVKGISNMNEVLGIILTRMGQYDKALEYYLKTLQIEEQLVSTSGMASAHNNIGIVYTYLKDYDNAIHSYRTADSLSAVDKTDLIHYNVWLNIGEVYEKKGRDDSAIHFYTRAKKWASDYRDDYRYGKALLGIGNVQIRGMAWKAAQKTYTLGLNEMLRENDEDMMCEAYLGLAKTYEALGQHDSSLYFARNGLFLARKLAFLSREQDLTHFLASFFAGRKRMDSAYYYQGIEFQLKDSLLGMEQLRMTQQMTFNESLRQVELQEKMLKEKEERRQQLQHIFILMFIPSMFLVTILLARRRVSLSVIKFLGILSLLFFFEYITLLMHPVVQRITHHTPIFEILIFVSIAAILIPTHHKIEHWLIELLVKRIHPNKGSGHIHHEKTADPSGDSPVQQTQNNTNSTEKKSEE